VSGAPRNDTLRAVAAAMAPLDAELVELDSAAMVSAILAQARRRCLIVLLTDLNPAALGDGLLPRLPLLTSRHLVVLGSVADPRLDELASGRNEASAVYAAAAAERALAGRSLLAARLRRQGVTVVDAPPDRLGKLAMGLRVVSDDGSPERFRQALVRALAGVVEIWMLFGSPALITSLLSAKGKRLGDLFAGTFVIQERLPKGRYQGTSISLMSPMPPQLARWASTLELSALPDPLANAARDYLGRYRELTPQARYQLGERLAADVAARVSPPPPPGTPAPDFLSAVLAERRARQLGARDAPC
jgi:hypothetical protein